MLDVGRPLKTVWESLLVQYGAAFKGQTQHLPINTQSGPELGEVTYLDYKTLNPQPSHDSSETLQLAAQRNQCPKLWLNYVPGRPKGVAKQHQATGRIDSGGSKDLLASSES